MNIFRFDCGEFNTGLGVFCDGWIIRNLGASVEDLSVGREDKSEEMRARVKSNGSAQRVECFI